MSDTKALLTIKNVLMSTQGATGEMLSEGIFHALQDRPEERHELQVAMLKMVAQVLTATRTSAKIAAEGECQQKVNAGEASVQAAKAAVASASQDLAAAQAAGVAQKEMLEQRRQEVSSEEVEQQRLKGVEEEKAKEMAALEQGKAEVVELLRAMGEKGNGEVILKYMSENNAETPLVAAMRSVLKKEASERVDFDALAQTHLQSFLEQKVASWVAEIKSHTIAKDNIHAEVLGSWAIKEVGGEHVKDAMAELESAEAAVDAAKQTLKQAKQAEHQEERILSDSIAELTLAGEKARQCGTALELLERLEAGQDMVQETSPMAGETVMAMEVDDLVAAKMDAMVDEEMGAAITA